MVETAYVDGTERGSSGPLVVGPARCSRAGHHDARPALLRAALERCATEAAWIDAATVGTVPFAVPGDFNRAFDVHGQGDHLWQEIDDGDPAGLDLWRLPFRQ
jgi:hypothetical protein